jgi:3-hydroxyacyl-[acyl-carrier-protein] dehydratase
VRSLRGNLTTLEHFYPLEHPAAEGHFPGNPIIPGAVLLSDALRAIEASLGGTLTLSRITAAKFRSPIRPGDRVLIEFAAPLAGQIKFTCAVDGMTVLTGEAICHITSTAN